MLNLALEGISSLIQAIIYKVYERGQAISLSSFVYYHVALPLKADADNLRTCLTPHQSQTPHSQALLHQEVHHQSQAPSRQNRQQAFSYRSCGAQAPRA